jgi:hypothetical protein
MNLLKDVIIDYHDYIDDENIKVKNFLQYHYNNNWQQYKLDCDLARIKKQLENSM